MTRDKTISKNHLTKEISELRDMDDTFMFRIGNDWKHKFIITLSQDGLYYIEVYRIHNENIPRIIRSCNTKKETLKMLSILIPDHLKVHRF